MYIYGFYIHLLYYFLTTKLQDCLQCLYPSWFMCYKSHEPKKTHFYWIEDDHQPITGVV